MCYFSNTSSEVVSEKGCKCTTFFCSREYESSVDAQHYRLAIETNKKAVFTKEDGFYSLFFGIKKSPFLDFC
jgi:hypothetical protein